MKNESVVLIFSICHLEESYKLILEMMMESIFAIVDIAYVSRVSVNAVATYKWS